VRYTKPGEWIVVGLGNPGPNYSRNRHNLGFMVADALAEEAHGSWIANRGLALACRITLADQALLLIKPQTYMNLSGKAVYEMALGPRADLTKMIVIHDDLDLAQGSVRIKVGGGDGGHKGIRSVADSLGSKEFIRVRLGIGRPPHDLAPEKFVLSSFAPEEGEIRNSLINAGLRAIRLIVEQGVERAQNLVHSDKLPATSTG
jgi:peptidyl-tRNA hydrolase, PTH1 family